MKKKVWETTCKEKTLKM